MKRLALVASCLLSVGGCARDEAGTSQPRIPSPFWESSDRSEGARGRETGCSEFLVEGGEPTFLLDVDSETLVIPQGGTGEISVTLTLPAGSDELVCVTVEDLPTEILASELLLSAGNSSGVITITAPWDTGIPVPEFARVRAHSTGGSRSVPISLAVRGPASSMDPSFSMTGPFSLGDVYDLVELPNGKLFFTGDDTESAEPIVCRLNADGSPDTSFGASFGCLHIDVGVEHATGVALVLDGNSLLISGGRLNELFVARISVTTGTLDQSFGTGGVTRLLCQQEGWIRSMQVSGGDIYLAGGERGYGINRAFAVRLDETGQLDRDFGTDGWIRFGSYQAHDLVPLPGRIVATTGLTLSAFDLSGLPDSTFGDNGSRELPLSAAALALDREGNLLAAGEGMAVVKLSPAGAILQVYSPLDPGEDESGWPMRAKALDLVVEDDGAMVFAGSLTTDDFWFGMGRRLPNGDPDPAFGVGGARNFYLGSIARRVRVLRDGRYAVVGTADTTRGIALRVWD